MYSEEEIEPPLKQLSVGHKMAKERGEDQRKVGSEPSNKN